MQPLSTERLPLLGILDLSHTNTIYTDIGAFIKLDLSKQVSGYLSESTLEIITRLRRYIINAETLMDIGVSTISILPHVSGMLTLSLNYVYILAHFQFSHKKRE